MAEKDFLPEWGSLRMPSGAKGPRFISVRLEEWERLPREGRYWVNPRLVASLAKMSTFRQEYQRAMLRLGLAGHMLNVPVWVSEDVPMGEVWWSLTGNQGPAPVAAPRPADWEEHMAAAYASIPRVEDLE